MKIVLVLFLLGGLFVKTPGFGQVDNRYTIIPRPASIDARPGEFVVNPSTRIRVPVGQIALKTMAETFAGQLHLSTGLTVQILETDQTMNTADALLTNAIVFVPVTDTALGAEGYRMDVTAQRITIEATAPKGFFYAVQTLYQLLPPVVLGNIQAATLQNQAIPACRIVDRPRYRYRGLHLDVSRHFFPVAFIKKQLDLMALHKFNTFHWHLTDDQGWRIEIKKYPRLTEIGSRRRETIVGHYDEFDPQVFDGKPYGGFYTQDDIREVVRYAQSRYITVVPEIELPGHAMAALAAYPELACAGKDYTVSEKWGVFADVFCPTEQTFRVLEDVLTEVIALFPSPYIHIGGDECPKSTWRKSAFCQQLMKRQRLKNANELQHYFIRRIDRFVTAKGRTIIGWDEILEGGGPTIQLSPTAVVMSWRGQKGGIQAAKQGYDVVMTPDKFCYLNYYQADPAQEPTAFGGYLPISKVYSYNPTPAELTPTQAGHIAGVQGNLWTEYIATPEQVEYMLWPRAAALAEVAWTADSRKEYSDFSRRLVTHFERLSHLNVNYARSFYDVTITPRLTDAKKMLFSLAGSDQTPDLYYTTDGSTPTLQSTRYTAPFPLEKSATVRAVGVRNGQVVGNVRVKEVLVSAATGKPYTLTATPTPGRPDWAGQLTNGLTASVGGYELTDVVSFKGVDFGAVVDLGQAQSVTKVTIGFLNYSARDICLPAEVSVALSADGTAFAAPQTLRLSPAKGGRRGIERVEVTLPVTTARYVRITAPTVGKVPAGLRNPGHTAQVAVDEITVD